MPSVFFFGRVVSVHSSVSWCVGLHSSFYFFVLVCRKKIKSACVIVYGRIGRNPNGKVKNLIRLGVDQDHAYSLSRTRKGGWAIAQSPIMITTITLKRHKQRGYIALLDVYTELNPSFYEPPYTRTVRTFFFKKVVV